MKVYALFIVYFPEPGAPGSNECVVDGIYSTPEKAMEQRPGKWFRQGPGEWWQHYDAEGAFCIEEWTVDAPRQE